MNVDINSNNDAASSTAAAASSASRNNNSSSGNGTSASASVDTNNIATDVTTATCIGGGGGDGGGGGGGARSTATASSDHREVTGMAISCLESLVAMLVHRKTVVTKAADFQPAQGSWQYGIMPEPDQELGMLDFCRALFRHLEPKLSNLATLQSSMRLVSTLVLLLPHSSTSAAQASTDPDSAEAMSSWLDERSAVHDCLAILAGVLVRHFEQQSFNTLLINLLMIFVETVERCVSPADASTVTSEPLVKLITEILSNEYLKAFRPKIKAVLGPLIPYLNPALESSLDQVDSIRLAMKRAVSFLTAKRSFGARLLDAPLGSTCAMLQHATAGIDALYYIRNPTYVNTAVDLCLSSAGIVRAVPSLRSQATALLSQLLAFPGDAHRTAAYLRVQNILESNPNPSVLAAATQLLQSSALLSRLVFGLDDAVPAIAEASRWLFLQISEPDESTGTLTRDYVESLINVIPLLQAFSADDTIGWRVKELAADAIVDPRYLSTATVLVPIRAMYHRDQSVRQWASDKLSRHKLLSPCKQRIPDDLILGSNVVSSASLSPSSSSPYARAVAGMLHADGELASSHVVTGMSAASSSSTSNSRATSPLSVDPTAGWSEHSAEAAVALVKVLSNEDVDLKLRVSAAEHIGMILQSGQHHAVLLQHRLFAIALKSLESLSAPAFLCNQVPAVAEIRPLELQGAELSLAAACMHLLQLLMVGSTRLRHSNQHDHECPAVVAAVRFLMAVTNCRERERSAAALLIATVAFDVDQVSKIRQLSSDATVSATMAMASAVGDGYTSNNSSSNATISEGAACGRVSPTAAAAQGISVDDQIYAYLQAPADVTHAMASYMVLPQYSAESPPVAGVPAHVEDYRSIAETIWCMLVLDGPVGMLQWRDEDHSSAAVAAADQSVASHSTTASTNTNTSTSTSNRSRSRSRSSAGPASGGRKLHLSAALASSSSSSSRLLLRGNVLAGSLDAFVEPHMLPSQQVWRELQSLHTEVQVDCALDGLRDASTYSQVMESLGVLEALCFSSVDEMKRFCKMDWQSAFDRYISVAPSTETNAALLSRMLSFLANVVSHDSEMPVPSMAWLAATTRNHLLHVLDGGSIAEKSEVTSSIIRELKCNILRLGIALLEDPRAFNIWGATGSAQCIVALMPHLMMGRDVEAESDRVYDLYVLTLCLRCTALLTGPAGSCCAGASDQELYGLTTELIGIANARSFSGDPEGRSFKGRRMCQLALMCTRQVAAALRARGPIVWGAHWLWNGSIAWLAKQFSTREPVARVEALGLVSDFLHTVEGTTMLLKTHFVVRDGTLPLIDAMFAIIFDADESAIVRCAATEVLISFTIAGLHLPGLSHVSKSSPVYGGGSFASSHSGGLDSSRPDESSAESTLHPIVSMFIDQCFFQNLRALIADSAHSNHLIEAIGLLCNNLLAIDAVEVLQQLNQFAIWQSLAWIYVELKVERALDPNDTSGKDWSRLTAQGAVMRTISSGLVAGGRNGGGESAITTGTNAAGIAADVLSRKGFLEAAFAAITLPKPDLLMTPDDSEFVVRAGEAACASLSVLMQLLESHPNGISIIWEHVTNDPQVLRQFLAGITSGNSASWHPTTAQYYFVVRLATLQFFAALFQSPTHAGGFDLVTATLDAVAPRKSTSNEMSELVQRELYGANTTSDSGSISDASEVHSPAGGKAMSHCSQPIGAWICQVMLMCWKDFRARLEDRLSDSERLVKAAKDLISSLVAISSSAKRAGLENGLLDLISSEIRDHHAALCVDSVEGGWGSSSAAAKQNGVLLSGSRGEQSQHRRQQQSLPKKSGESKDGLVNVFGMLGNLMYDDGRLIKKAVLRSSLPAILESTWGVCALDAELHQTMLNVLCNLVSGNTADDASCLAVPTTNKNSLVRRCAKLTCRLLRTNTKDGVLRLLFDFLSAVVTNNDCRAAMWREGLLEECLLQLTNRKSPHAGVFKFLACASHIKDAQTALCRSKPIISAIVDHTHPGRTNNRRTHIAATKILRNICFLRQARSVIAGNPRFMGVLRQLADSVAEEVSTCAQEALWSLLRHSNKTDRRRMWPEVCGVLQQKQLHMHDAMMASISVE